MNLGRKIQANRAKLGLTQEVLAEKLNVSRQSVSKWELDQALPEIDKIVEMSKLFSVTTDALLIEHSNTICQSCGMLMDDEKLLGTNADGTKSDDYCCYCLIEGKFGKDETMYQMIESCIPFRINDTDCPDAESARKKMLSYFPTLKRWRNFHR